MKKKEKTKNKQNKTKLNTNKQKKEEEEKWGGRSNVCRSEMVKKKIFQVLFTCDIFSGGQNEMEKNGCGKRRKKTGGEKK